MSRLLRIALTAFVIDAGVTPAGAQTPTPPAQTAAAAGRLRVYLDCFHCFPDYVRDEIKWADFVRQPQDADVHLLSSSQETGGGGRQVVLRFVGRGSFDGQDYELRVVTLPADADETRRRAVFQTVVVGLLHYMARSGLPAGLNVEVEAPETGGAGAAEQRSDPWNLWVFEVSGRGSYQEEESQSERSWDLNFSADRVTEAWKLSFGIEANQEIENFQFDPEEVDEGEPTELESKSRNREGEFFIVKSLGPHWSAGVRGLAAASTFDNYKFRGQMAPAVEYSVFPYRDYASQQLTFAYDIGFERVRYNELTIFDKLDETLYRHGLEARLDQRQTWGTLQAGAEFQQYLHDLALYRLEFDSEIDIRLARGLSVSFEGSASRIRDQVSLPRRTASQEEVLLRLRQLRSGYEFSFSFGLSYTFGSVFNNIVNPRFGG
ncbi:MAG TPA: hypothetical protein VFO19_07165 [Vicinamibacterales bacterium]|nr:hypothetical protein [Vicinamibacterales bacterium]